MPTYLWTGRTPEGREEAENVTADTPEAAREILEARGWTELRQHTTEIHEFVQKQVRAATHPDYRQVSTPQQTLAYMKGTAPGGWSLWMKALVDWSPGIIMVLALLVWSIYRQRPGYVVFNSVLLVFLVFFYPVVHLWFGRTKRLFRQLHAARNWRRWDEVLACLDKLEKTQRSTKIGIGDSSMARYRALALAGLGRLDEAIAGFSDAAAQAKMPDWLFHVHLASIYITVKQYDHGLEMYRLALEEAKDKSVVWIDLGTFLVERYNRPEEAKQFLALAEKAQLSELAKNHLPILRGKIAYREKDYAAMDRHLREALAGFQRQPPKKYYIFEPSILKCKGYLALSSAALGKKDEARKFFAEAGDYLQVLCLDEVVAQYRAIMH